MKTTSPSRLVSKSAAERKYWESEAKGKGTEEITSQWVSKPACQPTRSKTQPGRTGDAQRMQQASKAEQTGMPPRPPLTQVNIYEMFSESRTMIDQAAHPRLSQMASDVKAKHH